MKDTLYIVMPAYNEEANIEDVIKQWHPVCERISKEGNEAKLVIANDGSKDNTIQLIKQLNQKDNRIAYVDLSRNFGKEAAMLAGFDYATGNCMVIMDADLQHPPHLIPEMLQHWEAGYDDVYAKRTTRGKESWLRKNLSLLYYKLLQKTTRVEILQNVGDFRLLDRKCIDTLKQLRESERYTKGMFCWIGFNKKEIEFEQGDRVAGAFST